MSAFDVAIGLNEDGMNSLSQQVYQRIYPNVFKGTTSAGGNTVSYDIKSAPKFNLLTTSEAQAALKQYLAQHTGNLTPDEQQFVNDMSENVPTFILDFGAIDATLDSGGGNTTDDLVQIIGGFSGSLNYTGGDGTAIVLENIAAIPEPSAFSFLGFGAGLVFLFRRRIPGVFGHEPAPEAAEPHR